MTLDRHWPPRHIEPPARPAHPWMLLGVGALAGASALILYQAQTRNRVGHHPPDSAPGRTSRQSRQDDYRVVGRTVTIDRPRQELYAYCRDFQNLVNFMQHVRSVSVRDMIASWTLSGPRGDVQVETRIVSDKEGEQISWRSTEASEIETTGKIMFRDAPAGRGTEVTALIAYIPPHGEIGRWIATAFQREPAMQGRRELKRLKMLMETGEIATNHNRRDG